jgi:hypothetical protein
VVRCAFKGGTWGPSCNTCISDSSEDACLPSSRRVAAFHPSESSSGGEELQVADHLRPLSGHTMHTRCMHAGESAGM